MRGVHGVRLGRDLPVTDRAGMGRCSTDPVRAYHAALAINALVMSMAAVPAYFLGRMFVAGKAAILVAAMTVLVPSMAYTGVVMTENASYPVFLLAVLLIARAVRTPSIANQALALVGLGVCWRSLGSRVLRSSAPTSSRSCCTR